MKTTQRGFIVPLLLILIALVLAGGGAYIYTQMKQANPFVSEGTALPQASSTELAANSQTADWKTYVNTKYHYSIRYPSNLTITFQEEHDSVPPDQSSSFNLGNFASQFPIRSMKPGQFMIFGVADNSQVCHASTTLPSKVRTMSVDGVEAVGYILNGEKGDGMSAYEYALQKTYDSTCFHIDLSPYPTSGEVQQEFDQIVSTFKFNP